MSFYEALTMLAEQNGIPVPQRREGPQADAETKRREALHAMHDIAQRHFAQQLNSPAGREALAYLEAASSTAKTSSVSGWATRRPAIACLPFFAGRAFRMSTWPNPAWLTVRPRGGTSTIFPRPADVSHRLPSRQSDRLRREALRDDQQPKYLNSRETPIYNKSAVLYNLNRAKEAMRKENRVVLVEGYMDVIGVARTGVGEIVATCGTRLTPDHVRVLRRLVDHVVVNFDSDRAGVEAAERSVGPLLKEGFAVRVLELPGGLDPDEYCREHGPDAYRDRLGDAPSYFVWLEEQTRRLRSRDAGGSRRGIPLLVAFDTTVAG
ncbi:MAG: toprim domain-containing protein [Bryobacterales bacterium]